MIMKKPGFTLIELLVTATIIIVLMGIGVVAFSSTTKSSRDARRKADMEAIRQALVLKKSESGTYGTAGNYDAVATLISSYLAGPAPSDPKDDATNGFAYSGHVAAAAFCVCAKMENTGKGNAHTASTGVACTYDGTRGYYCVSNP